ncbi:response regulator transcription factor [bacterium]|nr:response regulator transcription factor [bacterium]
MLYVVIIEDNKVAADLLREYIESEDVKVSALYTSGEDALKSIPSAPLPDVLLVDIGLPGISGIEVTRTLKKEFPGLEIIIQTVFEDTATIIDSIKAGASGYILKASSREEIIRALNEVKKGGSFLSGKVARKILHEFKDSEKSAATGNGLECYSLTTREEEILDNLVHGASYKEISSKLDISVHTVNNHIRKIYEKMRVHSRGEAVARAIESSVERQNDKNS